MWRTWRKRRDVSQRQLADAVGVRPTQMCSIESGTRAPSVTVLYLLCEQLGLDEAERAEALRLSFEAAQRLAAPAKEAA